VIGEIVIIDPFWVPVFLVAAGMICAFFGRRLVAPVLAVAGLFLGMVYGSRIAAILTDNPGFIRLGPWIFGGLFAILSGLFLKAALFLAGAVLALAAVNMVFAPVSAVVSAVAAVLGGGLACAYRNGVFAVLTAAFGGLLVSSGAVSLAADFGFSIGTAGYFLILAAVFASGLLVQLRDLRRGSARKRKRR
jgi:hypothetical protein